MPGRRNPPPEGAPSRAATGNWNQLAVPFRSVHPIPAETSAPNT